jgi:hypothetical protein
MYSLIHQPTEVWLMYMASRMNGRNTKLKDESSESHDDSMICVDAGR